MFRHSVRIATVFFLPFLALTALSAAFTGWPVRATTLTVDTLADENDGCGVGACSLRDAINDANAGDTIDFNVSGTIDISGNGQLVISKSVTISSSLPITVSGNKSVRVFKVITGTTPTVGVTFGGMTIAFGSDNSTDCFGTHSCGGGLYVGRGTVVTVAHSTIISNTASRGGGIFSDGKGGGASPGTGASLIVHDSSILFNDAGLGGGIGLSDSGMVFLDSTFEGNSAAFGGALYYEVLLAPGLDPAVVGVNFFYNKASGGGAIYNNGVSGDAHITISDSAFSDNSAVHGGAIYNDGFSGSASLTLNNSSLISNSALFEGGGIYNDGRFGGSAILTITLSSLISNTASQGGGIFNDGEAGSASLTLNNATVAGNSAGTGGGIHNDGSSGLAILTSNNSTFVANQATNGGGAVENEGPAGIATATFNNSTLSGNATTAVGGGAINNVGTTGQGVINLYNSTMANNATGTGDGAGVRNNGGSLLFRNSIIALSTGDDCFSDNGPPAVNTNNFIGDNTCSPNFFGNPMIDVLADNGGDTFTHALLPGSPAIDAGDDIVCLSTDQRGIPRPQDGDNDLVANCDIGSFEVWIPFPKMKLVHLPIIWKDPEFED